jgi:glucosamine-6-phosphate deaminase
VEWDRVVCVQMDEYAGVGAADPRSTASELLREFVAPLGIHRFMRFYDDAGASTCSLDVFQQQIETLGGIDCAVHGVGRNAHIAFNEPGPLMPLETRVVALAESTRLANGVTFSHGVTLGFETLRRAKASLVVLRGCEKQRAAQALLFDPPGPGNPAAYLRACSRLSVYLDREAEPAGELISKAQSPPIIATLQSRS